MKMLIINADDFGYSVGINDGIIDSHKYGVLTSTTLMANMPGFSHAVSLAKDNPKLGVGVHLTLTCDKPVLKNVSSLVQDNGYFHSIGFYEQEFKIDADDLYKEWKAQIEKVIASGIIPTHLDSHHVNSLPGISEVFNSLAREYKLPVRGNYVVPKDIKTTKGFYTDFDSLATNKEIWKHMDIKNLIDSVISYGTVEAMCHPGYIDFDVFTRSSLTKNRTYTVKELQRNLYKDIFTENNIVLGNYQDL